ncbi:MAG: capsule assembly Wzi family protein [Dysgonomonas sp.]
MGNTVVYSQNQNGDLKLDAELEASGVFSAGDYAPFWFTNNVNGIASEKRNKEYLRAKVTGSKGFFDNKLKLNSGADFLVAHNLEADIYIQQLFFDINYRALGLSIGMKERYNPIRNTKLSSGIMSYSNNMRPVPQIEVGIPEFTDFPFTHGKLQIKGGLSYGKFLDDKFKEKYAGDGNYVKNILFHRKYGYLKLQLKPTWDLIAGLDMSAQFGGDRYMDGKYVGSNPHGFDDYIKVLFNMSGGSKSDLGDQINKLGNSFGSWHIVFNYYAEKYHVRIYNEHFFEDNSGLVFRNMPDGLYGVELNLKKKQLFSSILFEFLYARNHSGKYTLNEKGQMSPIRAADDYYNNYMYISASNYGFVVGNPFFVSPIYNGRQNLIVLNNKIVAYHAGVCGYYNNNLSYRLLLSYTRAYGAARMPETWTFKHQFSTMYEMTYANPNLKDWEFTGALAYDNSDMVGKNFGGKLSIIKKFSIK